MGFLCMEKKAELQQRLLDAMHDKVNVVAESTNIMVLDPKNFPAGAYWKTLQPTGEVEDPMQDNFYGPTDDPETRNLNPKKRKFDDAFDRPVFTGMAKVPVLTKFKRRKLNQIKNPESEWKTVGSKGVPNQDFLDRPNSTHDSPPFNFFDAFVPYSLTGK